MIMSSKQLLLQNLENWMSYLDNACVTDFMSHQHPVAEGSLCLPSNVGIASPCLLADASKDFIE